MGMGMATGTGRATERATERWLPAYEDRVVVPALPRPLLRYRRPRLLVLGLRGRRRHHAARCHTARLPPRAVLLLLAPALPRPQVLLLGHGPRGGRPALGRLERGDGRRGRGE